MPDLWFDGVAKQAQAFSCTEAVSFRVTCRDQDEVDHCWRVLGEGGEEGPCGWLTDRFGLSWQVVPDGRTPCSPTPTRAGRSAMQAVLGMRTIDVAALQAAADGVPVGT